MDGSKHQLARYREILKALNFNADTNKWQVKQGIEIDSANTGLKLQDRFRKNNSKAISKTANKSSSKADKVESRSQSNRSDSKTTSAFR